MYLVSHQNILLIMSAYLDMLLFLNVLFRKQVNALLVTYFFQFLSCLAGHCDCAAQQQQWFLFDPLHAYAEYIIEYEYLFSVRFNQLNIDEMNPKFFQLTNNTLSDQISRIKLEKIDDSVVTTYYDEINRDNYILPSKDEELPPKMFEFLLSRSSNSFSSFLVLISPKLLSFNSPSKSISQTSSN